MNTSDRCLMCSKERMYQGEPLWNSNIAIVDFRKSIILDEFTICPACRENKLKDIFRKWIEEQSKKLREI